MSSPVTKKTTTLIYELAPCANINKSKISLFDKKKKKVATLHTHVGFNHFLCGVWTVGSYLQLFWPLSTREEQKEDRITLLR